VVVIRGGTVSEALSFDEAVERARQYVSEGESPSRAAARAARESGYKRGEVYDRIVEN
jgi:hypothetical protein